MIRGGVYHAPSAAAPRLPRQCSLCFNKSLPDWRLWTMADRRLQVFHAVAKHLSFTKAAEAFCMTHPAVTFQVKQLEERFNSRLFEGGHGRIALTPAGHVGREDARRRLATPC